MNPDELVVAYRRGDPEAVEGLLAVCEDIIKFAARVKWRRAKDYCDPPDLYQQAVLLTLQMARSYKPGMMGPQSSFLLYLKIYLPKRLQNWIVMQSPKRSAKATSVRVQFAHDEEMDSISKHLGAEDQGYSLVEHEAILELVRGDPRDFEILSRYSVGYSYTEIAEQVGLNRTTVYDALARLRKAIKAKY